MQILIIILIAVHVLSSIFWAGSTFTLARLGGAGAMAVLRPQLSASIVSVASGAALWALLHWPGFYMSEQVLAVGILAALIATLVQASATVPALRATLAEEAIRPRIARSQGIASGLLVVTVACMAVARFI